jgi:cell division protein FtsL
MVVFGLVYLHVVSAQKQFELDRLQSTASSAQNTYEDLRLEVDQLDTPAHIMAIATAHGMVEPSSVTFLHIPAGAAGSASVGSGTVRAGQLAPAGAADWTRIKGVLRVYP